MSTGSGLTGGPITVAGVISCVQFGVSTPGCVPASGGGTVNFQRADGAWAAPAGAGSGTVTSVGLSIPSDLCTISGSPVTTAGTLTCSKPNTAPNLFLGGPASGAAAAWTLRLIDNKDIPSPLFGALRRSSAVCDGSTDDAAAIRADLTAMGSTGGTLLLPKGTCIFQSAINNIDNNVWILGAGMGATILKRGASVTGSSLSTINTKSNIAISDLTLDGNYPTATSAAADIDAGGATNVTIQRVEIKNPANIGVNLSGIRNRVLDSVLTGNGNAVTGSYGVWFGTTGDTGIQVSRNVIRNWTISAILGSGDGAIVSNNYVSGNHIQTSPSGGGQIWWTSSNPATNHVVTGNFIGPGGGTLTSGLEIDNISGLTVTGNTITGQNFYGAMIESTNAKDVKIIGNTFKNGGTAGANQPAILVAAGVSGWQVIGNRAYDDQGTQTQTYGIQVGAGASDNYEIGLNDFRGNKTGGILDGGTGVNKQIVFNLPLGNNTFAGDMLAQGTGKYVGPATALKSATTFVDVSAAAAPSNTQVLTATSSTTATWQAVSGALPSQTGNAGAVLATDGTNASWVQCRLLATLLSDSAAISNTTTPTAFSKSYSIPAGYLNVAGTILRIVAGGKYSTTGAPNLNLRTRLGGTNIFDTSVLVTKSGASNDGWSLTTEATVRVAGASGTLQLGPGVLMYGLTSFAGNQSVGTSAKDFTGALTADAQAEWGTASASNTVTMTSFSVWVCAPKDTIS